MPKLKTKSGAKKRFRLTAKGRVTVRGAKRSHIMTKETSKIKRQRRGSKLLSKSDEKSVKRMLRGS